MKRILLVSILLVSNILGSPLGNAESLPCPNTWAERMPQFKLTSVKGISDGMPYQWWSSQLTESDGSDSRGLSSPLNKKIAALGTNIEATFGFEVSTKSDFSVLKMMKPIENPNYTSILREIPPQEASLRSFGFMNGDYVRYFLDAYVKGCERQKLYSNGFQLNGLFEEGVGIDNYLKNPMLDESGNPTSFANSELVKATFEKNILNVLANPVVNKPISIGRPINQASNFYWTQYIYALSSPRCVVMDQPENLKTITFKSLPCKFGIFAMSKLTDIKREGALAFWQEGRPLFDLTLIGSFYAASKAPIQSIVCVKGKLIKKITAIKPVCPTGYKKK